MKMLLDSSSMFGYLWKLKNSSSRSITPENPTGEKGKGGTATEGTAAEKATELGVGWKINPFIYIQPHETAILANIDGPGILQHMWLTITGIWRFSILRIYWDHQSNPSVECPVGDFFACGWGKYAQVSSLAICVNPGSGLNSYWEMPFQKHCRITLTNLDDTPVKLYYQITYALEQLPEHIAYFHAQFRRVNPVPYKTPYTILDGVKGKGQYVGTYLAWAVHDNGWWGEGEVKFYIDGDTNFPTICGTGTEDYFGGAYNFENKETHQYQAFTTPYSGLPQIIAPDSLYNSQQRFSMYRWHLTDPIRFERDLRVEVQDLGWRRDKKRYLARQDDIASVAYWYQTLPTEPFPAFPSMDTLEII
jgi:hypothetical protein